MECLRAAHHAGSPSRTVAGRAQRTASIRMNGGRERRSSFQNQRIRRSTQNSRNSQTRWISADSAVSALIVIILQQCSYYSACSHKSTNTEDTDTNGVPLHAPTPNLLKPCTPWDRSLLASVFSVLALLVSVEETRAVANAKLQRVGAPSLQRTNHDRRPVAIVEVVAPAKSLIKARRLGIVESARDVFSDLHEGAEPPDDVLVAAVEPECPALSAAGAPPGVGAVDSRAGGAVVRQ